MKKYYEYIDDLKNSTEYQVVYNRLKLMVMNLFKWNGLPNSVDVEYLETTLHSKGYAIAFEDNIGRYILEGSPTSQVNIYFKPTEYQVSGYQYTKRVRTTECVVVKNNNLKMPTFDVLSHYAVKIADVQRTIDVLMNGHKAPFILVGDKSVSKSLRLIYQQVMNNQPAVIVDPSLNIGESLTVHKTDSNYIIDKLWDYKRSLWGEAKAFIGIDSALIDKKERLVVDEANADNDEMEMNLISMFESRQQACAEINEMWGIECWVEIMKVEVDDYEIENE